MQAIKLINQGIAFLLEIAMLISLVYCGFQMVEIIALKYLLALAFPVIVAVLWGIFNAPRSAHRLAQPLRMFFEMALYIVTAILLYKTGSITMAIALGATAIITEIVAFVLKN